MTRLYVEGAAGLVLLVVGLAFGWHFGSLNWKSKYDAVVVSLSQSSADASVKAAKRIQDQRDTYDESLKAITDSYHLELAASDTAADELTQQLRKYADRLSRCAVPKGAAASVGADDAAARSSSDREIADAIAEVVRATKADDEQMIALQAERRSLNQESSR